MENKTICIVGNGTSALKVDKGKLIDEFDTVVRFNRSPTRGYENHVGSKTTHRFVNRGVSKNLMEHPSEDIKFIPSIRNEIIILDNDNNITDVNFYKNIFHKTCKFEFISRVTELNKVIKNHLPNIDFDIKKPTGGLAVVSYYINQNYKVIIHGFDLEKNIDKSIIPHFYEQKKVKTTHNYNREVKILIELINKKIIQKL